MSAPKGQRGAITRVFVYGTLLEGEPNHGLLERASFVGQARTGPGFELRDLGAFPGLVSVGSVGSVEGEGEGEGGRSVVGELYDVDPATLAALDRLEGHPSFYRRSSIRLADGSVVASYLLRPTQVWGRPIIESGSWRDRHGEEQRA